MFSCKEISSVVSAALLASKADVSGDGTRFLFTHDDGPAGAAVTVYDSTARTWRGFAVPATSSRRLANVKFTRPSGAAVWLTRLDRGTGVSSIERRSITGALQLSLPKADAILPSPDGTTFAVNVGRSISVRSNATGAVPRTLQAPSGRVCMRTPTSSSSAPDPEARPPPPISPRPGRDVLLLEKASFPRDKICGDGLTPRAVRELVHLEASTPHGWQRTRGLRILGGGRNFTLDWPESATFPAYGMVRGRRQLDHVPGPARGRPRRAAASRRPASPSRCSTAGGWSA
jgi:hypothetical protein